MALGKKDLKDILANYDNKKITIGVLGSHSAEEVGVAAKVFGFPTVVVCQKGREELYVKYNKHIFDHSIILDKFSDIIQESVQKQLRNLNTIFLPNRSFAVYTGYKEIEEKFFVPIYGNRNMLRTEERKQARNQYWLLDQSKVRTPKRFAHPEDIDRLVIVKIRQKNKPLERAFFTASTQEQYRAKAEKLASQGIIDLDDLKESIIEEYVIGPRFNANFQAWALKDVFGEFDFLGFDDRRQVNLQGILNLTAKEQLELDIAVKNEEIGHFGVTMRESQKPLAYSSAERFLKVCEKEYPPGLIGPFALQGSVAYDPEDREGRKLDFFVFDVSPRIPGSPSVGPTSPEMRRLFVKYRKLVQSLGLSIQGLESVLDLPMLEICYAARKERLEEIVT